MDFGLVLPNYGKAANKESIEAISILAEKLNFNSIWVTDHIIVPAQYENPYGNLYEIIVTLSYVSAITKNVKIGSSVMVLPLREPYLVAKQLSTLDALSDGRVIFGVGGGWMEGEYEKIGLDFSKRGKILDKNIIKIREFWNGYNNFVSNPKPMQKHGPRILVGGNSKSAIKRAANFGDGWFPVGLSPQELKNSVNNLKKLSKGKKLQVYMRSLVEITDNPIGTYVGSEGKKRYSISGTSNEIINEINKFHGDLDSLVCYFGNKKIDDLINQIRKFAKEIMPSF